MYLPARKEEINPAHNAVFQIAIKVEDMCSKRFKTNAYLQSLNVDIANELKSQYMMLIRVAANFP